VVVGDGGSWMVDSRSSVTTTIYEPPSPPKFVVVFPVAGSLRGAA